MKSRLTLQSVGLVVLFLLFALLPVVGLTNYWIYIATIGFYYALLAASWSLLVGYVGRISFAQAAMSGLGAYASALTIIHFDWPIGLGLLAAVGIAAITGFIIGWLTLRLHGPYLGLTTIAFGEILRISATAEYSLTQGSRGLTVPPLIRQESQFFYYYCFFAVTVACLVVMWLLLRSRVGLFFQSIREDEDGAVSLGVNVTLWKCLAFSISSAFAGLAGALYAHFVELITPAMMSLQEMGLVLAMAVVGGFQNVLFAALGGMLLQILMELLRALDQWRLVVFGLATILALRFAPNGVFGLVFESLSSRWKRRA